MAFQLRYSERRQEQWFAVDRNWMSYSGMCLFIFWLPDVERRNLSALTDFLAQSEEAETRKHTASFDERLEVISQKLAHELSAAGTWRHFPHAASEAIERVALTNGFPSRMTSTGFAAWAIRHLPL